MTIISASVLLALLLARSNCPPQTKLVPGPGGYQYGPVTPPSPSHLPPSAVDRIVPAK